ncbi:N/A [soil metagenome]
MNHFRRLSHSFILAVIAGAVQFSPASAGSGDLFGCPVLAPPSPQSAMVVLATQPEIKKQESIQDSPTPVVSVKLRVPADVNVNQEMEYKIIVENTSTSPAHHVVLHNPLPAGVKLVRASPEPSAKDPELIWKLGTLSGGCKQEISLILLPTTTGAIANCARVEFEHGQCTTTKVHKPGLQVRREGPKEVVKGDDAKFVLTVTNTGDTELTNIRLEEFLPIALENESKQRILRWEMPTLAPGDSEITEYLVKAVGAGKACPRAVLRADGDLKDEYESCVQINEPKMNLVKSGPQKRYINLPAVYQITVENPGIVPLKGVSISDQLPEGATFVRASDNGEQRDNQVVWSVGDLEPGTSKTVELELKAKKEGTVLNQAVARADRGLTKQAEIKTVFAGVAALTMDVQHNNDPLEIGQSLTFNVTVNNPGTSAAKNVRVSLDAPRQLEIVKASGDADHEKFGNTITFNSLSVPAGGSVHFQVEAKAVKDGVHVRTQVKLEADQLISGTVEQEEVVTIYTALPASFKKVNRTVRMTSRLKPAK